MISTATTIRCGFEAVQCHQKTEFAEGRSHFLVPKQPRLLYKSCFYIAFYLEMLLQCLLFIHVQSPDKEFVDTVDGQNPLPSS